MNLTRQQVLDMMGNAFTPSMRQMLATIAMQESNGDPMARASAAPDSARGLMQVQPTAWKESVERMDPRAPLPTFNGVRLTPAVLNAPGGYDKYVENPLINLTVMRQYLRVNDGYMTSKYNRAHGTDHSSMADALGEDAAMMMTVVGYKDGNATALKMLDAQGKLSFDGIADRYKIKDSVDGQRGHAFAYAHNALEAVRPGMFKELVGEENIDAVYKLAETDLPGNKSVLPGLKKLRDTTVHASNAAIADLPSILPEETKAWMRTPVGVGVNKSVDPTMPLGDGVRELPLQPVPPDVVPEPVPQPQNPEDVPDPDRVDLPSLTYDEDPLADLPSLTYNDPQVVDPLLDDPLALPERSMYDDYMDEVARLDGLRDAQNMLALAPDIELRAPEVPLVLDTLTDPTFGMGPAMPAPYLGGTMDVDPTLTMGRGLAMAAEDRSKLLAQANRTVSGGAQTSLLEMGGQDTLALTTDPRHMAQQQQYFNNMRADLAKYLSA